MLGIQLDKRKARTEGIRYKKGFACVIYLVFLYNKKKQLHNKHRRPSETGMYVNSAVNSTSSVE